MIERGYDKRFVYGLLAAGGTLGILIPPSIPMIVYGFITEESVGALFLAGVGPGMALVVLFIAYSMVHARMTGVQSDAVAATGAERRAATLRAAPSIALAMLIIGGIYSGAFTPTEAAAVGFAAALLVTIVVLRSLSWKGLREAVFESIAPSARATPGSKR